MPPDKTVTSAAAPNRVPANAANADRSAPVRSAQTARVRVRAELTSEIKQSARRQLSEKGAADLSLRAVARDLGMVSSGVYRYFASRDELLTALIVDAYSALGEMAEAADAGCPADDGVTRFRTVGRAIRGWAVANPHEYALCFGSPVPGYAAPTTTVGPAARVPLVLLDILTRAHELGHLADRHDRLASSGLLVDAERLRAETGIELPAGALLRAMAAWPALFGAISFELFGHFHNVVADKAAWFDYELDRIMFLVGLVDS